MLNLDEKRGLWFLLLALGISVFVILWTFVLNKGAVVLQGEAPFEVKKGLLVDYKCEESPCKFRLPPGAYVYTVNKQGYQPENITVEVKRWQTSEISLDFKLEPVVKKLGEAAKFVYPAGVRDVKVKSQIRLAESAKKEQVDLSFYQGKIVWVGFRPQGGEVLVFDGTKYVLLDIARKELVFSRVLDALAVSAGLEEDVVYLEQKKTVDGQALISFSNEEKEQQITVFPREIKNAVIYPATGKEYFLLIDNTDGGKRIYKIDTKEKIKTFLAEIQTEELSEASLSLSGRFLFLRAAGAGTIIYDLNQNSEIRPAFSGKAAWLGDTLMIIDRSDAVAVAGDFMFESLSANLSVKIKRPSAPVAGWSLFSYAPETANYSRIVSLPGDISNVSRIEVDEEGRRVLLLTSSDEIFEVKF